MGTWTQCCAANFALGGLKERVEDNNNNNKIIIIIIIRK